jgi:hypothetical protein
MNLLENLLFKSWEPDDLELELERAKNLRKSRREQ